MSFLDSVLCLSLSDNEWLFSAQSELWLDVKISVVSILSAVYCVSNNVNLSGQSLY